MDKSYFLEILHKFQQGNVTKEEFQLLVSYYNLYDNEPDILALLNEEQKEKLKSDMQSAIWQNIQRYEQKTIKARFTKLAMIKIAAAIILPVAIVVFMLNRQSVVQTKDIVQSNKHKEHQVLHLPDGSTVIISAGSKLNYSSSFGDIRKREVYLEGQAYFDISHNASKPFIVHTGKIETTVLGTAFDIKAWPANADVIVTVIRGKVCLLYTSDAADE